MDHFHSLMFIKLDAILTATQPRKSVLFALDGPAPLAKLMTQRARRKVQSATEVSHGTPGCLCTFLKSDVYKGLLLMMIALSMAYELEGEENGSIMVFV